MMKINKKSRIWRVLLLTIIILAIDFVVISAAVLISSNYYVKDYIENDVYVQQTRAEQSIDEILFETYVAHERIFIESNIQLLTNSDDLASDFPTVINESALNSLIFEGVSLTTGEGQYKTSDDLASILAKDIEKATASGGQLVYLRTINNDGQPQIVFGRLVQYSNEPKASLGVVSYYLNYEIIDAIIGAVSNEYGASAIIDSEDFIIMNPSFASSGLIMIEGDEPSYDILRNKDQRIVRSVRPLTSLNDYYGLNWQMVTEISYYDLFNELTGLQLIILVVALITFAVSIIVAFVFGKKLINPVKKLSSKMTNYNPGETFTPTLEIDDDEIAQLEASYNQMIERINNLIAQNKEDAEVQRKLELDSLQQQINPHFLYNTLDTIAWMAKIKKEPKIEKLVLALAKFFRISLHKGDKFITVDEEIQLIQHFVEIELIRFPNKFTIEYNIDEDVKNYQTLKIIIQPIVENAIKHGISSLERMGHITINAYFNDGDVVYEIIDDGVGFNPPSDLFIKKEPYEQRKSGYGLFNVNERIKLEYGEQYGLSVESALDQGTKITVTIEGRI